MKRTLEVCIDSLASARAAIEGGADRLELCGALSIGGLTPYAGLLRQIRAEHKEVAIRCMIRPRSGDFHYTEDELQLMLLQIELLKQEGADGFVFGCLNTDGTLDLDAMQRLMAAANTKNITLHRAIDVSRDLEETYRQAAKLGIDTVLTSGGAANCTAGKETIGKLLKLREAEGGPNILIGAGVSDKVISAFRTDFPEAVNFHLSGKFDKESEMVFRRAEVPMGLPGLDEWHIQQTDPNKVRAAREALDK